MDKLNEPLVDQTVTAFGVFDRPRNETFVESIASICTVLVVGLFEMDFVFQNFEIPSESMEKTLLISDHVMVDRIGLAPPTSWAPLVYYRPVKHGDIERHNHRSLHEAPGALDQPRNPLPG